MTVSNEVFVWVRGIGLATLEMLNHENTRIHFA